MLRAGHVVILCVLALLMMGVIMVASADMVVRSVDADSPIAAPVTVADMLSSRNMVYFVLAAAAMLASSTLPVRKLAAFAEHGLTGAGTPRSGLLGLGLGVFCIVAMCALVYVPGLSREVNGSRRWIQLPIGGEATSVQPSELAKWGLVGLMAWYCARRERMLGSFWLGLVPALAGAGLVAGFIVLEDLGTGALIAMAAAIMLLAAGAKWWHFAALSPAPIAGFVLAITTSDYRTARIMAFVDPYKDPEGIGYHTVQSLIGVAGGGGFGRGLGFGMQKLGYLPEDRTDFVFAVLCEELGIPGAAVVVALFATLIWAGFVIMRRENSTLLRLMCLGIIATVGLQATINIAVVTAMAPTKGIALPLISAGGTGWILTAFSLGLLVGIERTQGVGSPIERMATAPMPVAAADHAPTAATA